MPVDSRHRKPYGTPAFFFFLHVIIVPLTHWCVGHGQRRFWSDITQAQHPNQAHHLQVRRSLVRTSWEGDSVENVASFRCR